ncbi:ferrous iron transport protein A [Chloroflexota bacterium]
MPDGKLTTLARMGAGRSGIIVEVQGGNSLVGRVGALGIRAGKRITKVSSMIMRGPVTIRVDGTLVALGFGMASKVMVQLDKAAG